MEIIYNNFNLINEKSIMDILYNITFPKKLVLYMEIIYKNFNLITEWSIMDILYSITFPNNLILD